MGRALKEYCKWLCLALALAGLISNRLAAQDDPPSRVARLNFLSGNVSMQPPGVDDWAPAEINHPSTIGDYLYTDVNAHAELHSDEAVMRMGSQTSFGFLNLNDAVIQIKLTGGDMSFRLHDLAPNQVFEVDTPNAAFQLARDGVYRFRVDPNGNMTFVVVRSGQAQVTGGGQSFALDAGNSAQLTGTDQLAFDVEAAPAPDELDSWCAGRDERETRLTAARYVPPTVIGSEDLDTYGDWQPAPEYGPVWYPHHVPAGWAPYQAGHWTWVEPWGWTWVDAAPWGFAPFHYGRWAYIGSRWGWCPGPIAVGYHGPVVRPYYAPALVAWFGGSHWGVSVTSGGPSLGWVALGVGEVFTPAYHCSRPYFSNVNVYNTHVTKTVNITNVYNTVYVNKTVYNQPFVNGRAPNGVYSMRQSAFASGQPVRQGGNAVSQTQFEQFRSSGAVLAPAAAPQRQAVPVNNINRVAARPNPQVMSRPVMAVQTPASAPASFQARQQYLESHAGELHDFGAMHRQIAPQTTNQIAIVRAEPKAQPIQVRPGEQLRGAHNVSVQQAASASAQPGQPQAFGSSSSPRLPANSRVQNPAPPVIAAPPERARERQQPQPENTFQNRARVPNSVPAPRSEPKPGTSAAVVEPRPSPAQAPAATPRYPAPEVRETHQQPAGPTAPYVQPSAPAHQEVTQPPREDHHAPRATKPEAEHRQPEHKDGERKNADHKSQ